MTAAHMPKLLYTVDEAAELVSTGRDTVYRLINDGDLQVINLGTTRKPKLRIALDQLQKCITAKTGYVRQRRTR